MICLLEAIIAGTLLKYKKEVILEK